MFRRLVGSATFAACAVASCVLFAQYPQPTAEHEILAQDKGTWTAKVKMWAEGPEGEPLVSEAKEENVMLGGFWLISTFEGELAGMPFTGKGMFGYDPEKKKYVGTWIDSMTPTSMSMVGTYDASTRTFTYMTSGSDGEGNDYKGKIVTKMKDDDHKTMAMYVDMDGTMVKQMVIEYSRGSEEESGRERPVLNELDIE